MTTPVLSIVFPCFNEAARLPETLERYLASFPEDLAAIEFVVVDDGSTDSTYAAAEKTAAGDPRVRVLRAESNHGKGYAVRSGVLAAEGELVVFTDADGSYQPEHVKRLVIALGQAPVAIGSRSIEEIGSLHGTPEEQAANTPGPILRRMSSRVFNAAMRLVLGLDFQDTQCGLKGFRREAARSLFARSRLDGFAFDVEVLFLARRLGYEVAEVPVTASDRDGSKVRLAVDALRMLVEVWSVRLAAARGVYDQARIRDHAG
jgi:dolichyl-phosphate beta-glucosyltransferase